MNSSCNVVAQNLNCGFSSFCMVHHSSNDGSLCPSVACNEDCWYTRSWNICKQNTVNWCAYLIRVTCHPDSNESARPKEVISASRSFDVRPLPQNQSPNNFNKFIPICKPLIAIRNLSSPQVSSQQHNTWLAMAYKGWSATIKGTCSGCASMHVVWAFSRNMGRSATFDTGLSKIGSLLARYADHNK